MPGLHIDEVGGGSNRPIKTIESEEYTFEEGDQFLHIVFIGIVINIYIPAGIFKVSDILTGTFRDSECGLISQLDQEGIPILEVLFPETNIFEQKGNFEVKYLSESQVSLSGDFKIISTAIQEKYSHVFRLSRRDPFDKTGTLHKLEVWVHKLDGTLVEKYDGGTASTEMVIIDNLPTNLYLEFYWSTSAGFRFNQKIFVHEKLQGWNTDFIHVMYEDLSRATGRPCNIELIKFLVQENQINCKTIDWDDNTRFYVKAKEGEVKATVWLNDNIVDYNSPDPERMVINGIEIPQENFYKKQTLLADQDNEVIFTLGGMDYAFNVYPTPSTYSVDTYYETLDYEIYEDDSDPIYLTIPTDAETTRKKQVILYASGFVFNATSNLYEYTFQHEKIFANSITEFTPDADSEQTVIDAGVKAETPISKGQAKILAVSKPSSSIMVDVLIKKVQDV